MTRASQSGHLGRAIRWVAGALYAGVLILIGEGFGAAPPGPTARVTGCVFSPDGKLLVCWGQAQRQGRIWLVETATGQLRQTAAVSQGQEAKGPLSEERVHWVAYSPSATMLAVVSGGAQRGQHTQALALWDVEKWELKQTLLEERVEWSPSWLPLTVVAFSPDGQWLAGTTAGWGEPPLRTWNLSTGNEGGKLRAPGQPYRLESVAFSPDGKQLAASGVADIDSQYYGVLFLWDLAEGQLLRKLAGRFSAERLTFGSNELVPSMGRWNSKGTTLKVWNTTSGDLQRTVKLDVELHENPAVDFSSDGRLLAVATREGVRLLDVRTGKAICAIEAATLGERHALLVFSGDGTTLATGGSPYGPADLKAKVFGGVDLWDTKTGALRARWIAPEDLPEAGAE